MDDRKKDHINLAFQSQTNRESLDRRFNYEPLLKAHPVQGLNPMKFLSKDIKVPLWVSSMTGGTQQAFTINHNLARACNEFGFGMGLGSCRSLLKDDSFLPDFDMRDIIGDNMPFYANLGISQVETIVESRNAEPIIGLVKKLRADGLIVHVNPLQEWIQPEGNVIKNPPIDTIKRLLDMVDFPVIVKEVGQGMGPESIRELMYLPLEAIEFGAFGGTNFAKVELLRAPDMVNELYEPLAHIGMDAYQMLDIINGLIDTDSKILCRQIIISGGIHSFLDGYYLLNKSKLPAVYGQASSFLKHASGYYETLHNFVSGQIKGLELAYTYLKVRE
jgi:isopentenyl-diphosphate Delta-isomerase